jgi:amidase
MSIDLLKPASELVNLVRRREISPVELVRATFEHIERVNPALNAIVTIDERAVDHARVLEQRIGRGDEVGPLVGLPVGIKDVTEVGGLRTTYGSKLYATNVADDDALVVQRLREAGAIVIGKTNCPEFAAGGNTFNDVFGRTRNPWNLERSAGGSTGGGAAALATGMIAIAEGTDLGGSLRIPASFCGVVGLRPSPGLVPTCPTTYAWDTLQVTGTMARTAEDVAMSLQAVAGPSPLAPLHQPATGRDFVAAVRRGVNPGSRIAYTADIAAIGVDPALEGMCRSAAFELREAGCDVEESDLAIGEARPAFLALRGYWFVAQMYTRLQLLDEFGTNVARNIRAGLETTASQFAAAERTRTEVWRTFREVFSRYDFLVTPCMAVPPFPVEQNYPDSIAGQPMQTYVDWIAPTFVLSLTGLPVASVPCGLDAEGLPVGMQIVGPPQSEERVLALAAAVQMARPIGHPKSC